MESPVLNAADYGIPQNRLRLYVVGIRKDIHIDSPFVFPLPQKLKTTVNDYLLKEQIPAKYYLGRKGFEFVTTHPTRAKVGSPIMNCQKATQQFNWNGDFIFEPLDPQKHTPEILAKAYIGEFKGEQGVIRMFTPRECLRLMGFPDSFKIVVNDNLMWRQAGNSIVVNVLESLMKQLIKTGVFETK
jgi:DNA (cytosine-5)-methyltransferase 1